MSVIETARVIETVSAIETINVHARNIDSKVELTFRYMNHCNFK